MENKINPTDLNIPGSVECGGEIFALQLVTPDYLFYCNENEGDDNANTAMYDRDLKLICDNYFATNELTGIVTGEEPATILWQGEAVNYWLKQIEHAN